MKEKSFQCKLKAELYDGCSCRQLMKSEDESVLILNKNDKSIIVFFEEDFETNKFNFGKLIHIKSIVGNEIRSIHCINSNHIAVVSADGFLSVYMLLKQKQTYKTLKMVKLPLTMDEEISCFAIGKKRDYITVASTLNLKPYRLFIFALDRFNFPSYVTEMDLSGEYYSKHDLSFFQDISMEYYIGDNPIILASQYDGDNLIVPFIFDGEEIGYLTNPKVYHSNVFCKYSYFEGNESLWSVDKNGTIKVLKLCLDEEEE